MQSKMRIFMALFLCSLMHDILLSEVSMQSGIHFGLADDENLLDQYILQIDENLKNFRLDGKGFNELNFSLTTDTSLFFISIERMAFLPLIQNWLVSNLTMEILGTAEYYPALVFSSNSTMLKAIEIIEILLFNAPKPIIGISEYFDFGWDQPITFLEPQSLFMFENNTTVETENDWRLKRKEISDLLLSIEYGRIPDHPERIQFQILDVISQENNSTLNIINLMLIPNVNFPSKLINMTVWIYIPSGSGPFPVVLKIGKDGYGSVNSLKDIILSQDYAYVCYDHIALDADDFGRDSIGICQELYLSYDWGTLAVWAWGAMRVMDFLCQEPWVTTPKIPLLDIIDQQQIIITGHSRRGKVALLAAALDERIAMTAPNNSGLGGAGSFLIQDASAENIALITSPFSYYYWFQQDFRDYAFKHEELPFDQHFLRALIAPRYIISLEATNDIWANPSGTQAMYVEAQEIFDFLNVSENNAIRFRLGEHNYLESDVSIMLDFADYVLKNLTPDYNINEFYMTPCWIDTGLPIPLPLQTITSSPRLKISSFPINLFLSIYLVSIVYLLIKKYKNIAMKISSKLKFVTD